MGRDVPRIASWGREALSMIRDRYAIPGSDLFAEAAGPGVSKKEPAFNWGVGVLLSAFNGAAKVDGRYKEELRTFADATRSYWNQAGPVPGYDVLPNAGSVDRYYDDNAWMVLALVETADVLGDRKYLGWAKDALKFCLSGEDDKLGGGIYWRENDKRSKNTCSNAPVAAACMAVFAEEPDPFFLHKAEELYSWTKEKLQDPSDHLMWDNIDASTGRVGKTKWSYNTALMIRTATDLYRFTRAPIFLKDVREMRAASNQRWLGPDRHELKDDGPFAHLLLEAWVRAESIDPTPQAARTTALVDPLVFIHESCRGDGFYGNRWDRPPAADQTRFQLIDQAAAARAFWDVAAVGRWVGGIG